MIRTYQPVERLIHTTKYESIFCAEPAGFALGTGSIFMSSFSWRSDRRGSTGNGTVNASGNCADDDITARELFIGTGLYKFMSRPYSLLTLVGACLDSAKQAISSVINRSANRPAQGRSICPSIFQRLEPKTIHRSRDHRQLAMFSF